MKAKWIESESNLLGKTAVELKVTGVADEDRELQLSGEHGYLYKFDDSEYRFLIDNLAITKRKAIKLGFKVVLELEDETIYSFINVGDIGNIAVKLLKVSSDPVEQIYHTSLLSLDPQSRVSVLKKSINKIS